MAGLAAFGTVQWRAAANAKRDVEDLFRVDDLVNAWATLGDDPELALLLAMQSVRETVDLGFATSESVDAVHFALKSSDSSTTSIPQRRSPCGQDRTARSVCMRYRRTS